VSRYQETMAHQKSQKEDVSSVFEEQVCEIYACTVVCNMQRCHVHDFFCLGGIREFLDVHATFLTLLCASKIVMSVQLPRCRAEPVYL
jgi:hypothetical protein